MRVEEIIELKPNVLQQGKHVDVKVRENVVRKMRVRKRSIFPAMQRIGSIN